MERLDRMPPAWRALVHDFGWTIVDAMIADGHRNAANLRQELEAWRERQQEAWLSEIPYGRLSTTRTQSVPQGNLNGFIRSLAADRTNPACAAPTRP
jgi:hypothetical protein